MLNQDSVHAVEGARLDGNGTGAMLKPLYGSFCFSRIPQTIYHLLTGDSETGLPTSVLSGLPDQYDKVILVMVDAFGWRFFEEYQERYPFLQRFMQQGVVSKLTSQFPSTTSAHVTTIHTGQPVGTSGVFEWFYYEPLVDGIIAPLLFSFAGDKGRETLRNTGVSPQALYPTSTVYQRFAGAGVNAYVFQHRDYTLGATYSETVLNGAKLWPYKTPAEGVANLIQCVENEPGKAYYYIYFDGVDVMEHVYGPGSVQVHAEVDALFTMLDRLLYSGLAGRAGKTLLLLTADHGQTEIDPKTTVFLNRAMPGFEQYIRTGHNGKPLIPAGSARDMFLYIKEGQIDAAEARLREQLGNVATIRRMREMIDQGFFGPPAEISPAFMRHAADLVILPFEHDSVWWYERGKHDQVFYGHHGGLTPAEAETLLLALPL